MRTAGIHFHNPHQPRLLCSVVGESGERVRYLSASRIPLASDALAETLAMWGVTEVAMVTPSDSIDDSLWNAKLVLWIVPAGLLADVALTAHPNPGPRVLAAILARMPRFPSWRRHLTLREPPPPHASQLDLF